MALSLAWLCNDRSVPRGRYWRSNLLVFSFEPRCQGDRGSQIDLDLGGQCQALMVGKLLASVPGQRPVKLAGNRCDCLISAETTLSVSLFATLTSIT